MLATIRKCGSVLNLFDERRPDWGVTELGRTLGMPKSSTHELLASLAEIGLLQRMPNGRYRLGWRISALNSLLFATMDCRDISREVMSDLVARFGETVHLGVLDWTDVVFIEKLAGTHAINVPGAAIGERKPAATIAVGKSLLACRTDGEVRALYSLPGSPVLRADILVPHVDIEALVSELAMVRRTFCAYNLGPEVCAIGAPIWDHSNTVVAGLSMSVPAYRYKQGSDVLSKAVSSAADRISHRLGASASLGQRWNGVCRRTVR